MKTERNNEILAQWLQGVWTTSEIAELHSINKETVRTIVASALRRRGVPIAESGDLRGQLAEYIVGLPCAE